MGPTMGFMGLMGMRLQFRNQRGPYVGKHSEIWSQPLYKLYGTHSWLTMGISWAKTMGMPYKKFCFTNMCLNKSTM